jgi:hypothetical protein
MHLQAAYQQTPHHRMEQPFLGVEVRLVLPSDGRIVGPVALGAMPRAGDAVAFQDACYRVDRVMWSFHGPILHLRGA